LSGTILTRDAGYITFLLTFDGDTFLSQTVSINNGPHPLQIRCASRRLIR